MLVVEFCFIFGDCLFIHSFFIYTLYICHLFYCFMLTDIVSSFSICIQKKKKKNHFRKNISKNFSDNPRCDDNRHKPSIAIFTIKKRLTFVTAIDSS